mmetsp:Transcript_21242/g.50537  ORF Transcript_21242/g.50537 Transcript_21242/m.50537 type:complete len:293 (-) Transcript_21242:16-894(-)
MVVRHPHIHHQLHDQHNDGRAHGREGRASQGSCDLLADQEEAARVDQALLQGKNACEHRTPDSAHAMQAEGVQSVVHEVELVQQLDGHIAPWSAKHPEEDAPAGCHEASCGGDAHQACHGTRHSANAGRLALQHPLHEDPGQHGRCRRNERGGDGPRGHAIRDRQGRAPVEAQPAEPQQGASEDHEGRVGRTQLLLRVPARADKAAGHEAGHAGADVHDGSPRKIFGSELLDPSAGAPDPVAERGVDHQRPQSNEHHVGAEPHALHQGPGDDGAGDDRESHLEAGEAQARQP